MAAYLGKPALNSKGREDATDILAGLSLMHGLANLVLDDKANHLFGDKDTTTFVRKTLPELLKHMYPGRVTR